MRWSQAGLRTKAGLALEAGDCRDVHHAAVLIGYGAGAVCPWLALQTARNLAGEEGEARLLKALQAGLAKVMSKMGISVLDSYRAAQLFDILGLDDGVVDRCFPGSPSPLGGWGFQEIENAIRASWSAENRLPELPDYGWVRFRRDDGRGNPHVGAAANPPSSDRGWRGEECGAGGAQRRLRMPRPGRLTRARGKKRTQRCCETCWSFVLPVRACLSIRSSSAPAWYGASCRAPCRWVRSVPRRIKPSLWR